MAGPSVIVVGAGAGGIATAARLAQQGCKVKVIEKQGFVGGRCSLLYHQDHRFDQGPSLLLMPELFEETFRDLNTSIEQEKVEILKCEPNYCIWFADHDIVELSSDLARLKREVERYEGPGRFSNLCAFLAEAGRNYELSLEHVLRKDYPGALSTLSLLRPDVLWALLRMRPWTSVYGRVSKYFQSERMRRVWTFSSMYMGMSPYSAPGTYSLLQYSETVDGIGYPRGGFQAVLQAIADIGERYGVQYRLNNAVESVILSDDDKIAKGVRLASGEVLYADLVVLNADLVYSYNELLPPSREANALKRRSTSCSSISFFWAFDEVLPQLRTHNVFLAEEYRASFDSIFNDHTLPAEPSFYVNVPSHVDSTAAPDGKETVVVLVPIGHLTSNGADYDSQAWKKVVSKTREFVLNAIESRTGLRDLRSKIVFEKYETPLTWESKYNLDRGAILGLSHSFLNVLTFRPKSKHPSIENLYFVGASTHPGTGVPVCLAGAKLVAEKIMKAYKERGSYGTGSRVGTVFAITSMLLALVSLIIGWADMSNWGKDVIFV